MKKINILVIFLILVMCFISNAEIKKLGQAGLKFLSISVSPRASGVGDAFIMMGNDVNSIFYNPAGLSEMKQKYDAMFSVVNWIADIKLKSAAVAWNAGSWGNLGLSFISVDYGDIYGTIYDETSELGFTETGLVNTNAYAVGLTYGRRLTERFMVGGKIQYAYQYLGDNVLTAGGESVKNEVSGLVYNFGTMFYPGYKSLRLGMTIVNFSPEFKYEKYGFQLPLTFKVGAAMDILELFGEYVDHSLVLDIEGIHPRDYTQRIHVGGEYWFKNMVAIRAGYKFNYDIESLTIGIGFKIGGLKFDYAYGDLEYFNAVNRFAIGFNF